MLGAAGFAGESLDIALGVAFIEADGPKCTDRFGVRSAYGDAVGDLALIDAKWGPSLSLLQVRTLRHPEQYPFPDTLRVAAQVRYPRQNAEAAFQISKEGTDFTKWSAFKSGAYLPHVGKDFEIRSGHPDADRWNA